MEWHSWNELRVERTSNGFSPYSSSSSSCPLFGAGTILVGQRIVCNRPYPAGSVQFATLFRKIRISSGWLHWLFSVHPRDRHLALEFATKEWENISLMCICGSYFIGLNFSESIVN